MAPLMSTEYGSHRRIWKATALSLRVICLALLVLMFSFKLRDFLRQPVVSETNVVPASLPAITICPSRMNTTELQNIEARWDLGLLATEEVLQATAAQLECSVFACSTADGDICTPGGRERNDGLCGSVDGISTYDLFTEPPDANRRSNRGFKALWQSRRVPPGITCHTLKLSSAPGNPILETLLTLALHQDFLHNKDGYYRLFFHTESSPKTWYGGTLVSPYHLVYNGFFQELVLTQTEILSVDRPLQRCQPGEDYDFNQCLLDCRSLVAFTEANCSVQWGAATGGLPPCITKAEYDAAVTAWRAAHPDCTHCLRPCKTHMVTLGARPAMFGYASPTVQLQIRFDSQQLLVEQRFAYTLVDLLVDLGGTFGLLLGYSLMSLADMLDTVIAWFEGRRRRQGPGGADAATADAPALEDAIRIQNARNQRA